MRRSLLVVLVVAVSGLVSAQQNENADWYINQPIQDVTFVGLSSVSEADLRPIVSPYIGEPFTERRFLELQRRLYALDFFVSILPEAVRPETGTGVIIQFTVEERPTADEIDFVGNRRIRTTDLLDAVLLKPGDMITLAKRRVDEAAIQDLYLERGYPDVVVTSRVEEKETTRGLEQVVVFDIEEGEQVTIREIRFSGNTFASESTLRGRMDSKAQSIFNSGVYQSRVLEEDRLRLEEYYRERGYVDATVTDITQKFERDEDDEKTYLILTVFIDEGEQYTFGGITFEGNTIFSDEELLDLVRVREDAVLDSLRLQEGIAAVQDLYYQNGYIFNQFSVSEERDEQALTISFVMQITEQARAHIENIIVRGNDKTLDYVIEREIPLQVGDVFSVARIREGIQNLTNLQYFSAINPETPQGSVEGLMDLIINVEEAQTADIRFGVSFGGSSEFPVSAQVGWADSNFQGRGQTLGFQVNASPVEQNLSLNFLERWLAGQRWSLGADVSINRRSQSGIPQDILAPVFAEDDINAVPDPFQGYYVFSREGENDEGTEYPENSGTFYQPGEVFPDPVTTELIDQYDLVTDYQFAGGSSAIPGQYLMEYKDWSISTGANTGYRFRTSLGLLSLSTSLRASINYVDYEPTEARPFDPDLRANLDDWRLVTKLAVGATLDRRQGIPLSPSSGFVLRQGLTSAGGLLFGNRHYLRTDTTGEAYFTLFDLPVFELWSWKTVLALHSEISFILPQLWLPREYRDRPGQESLATREPVAATELLQTNPMFIARGWDPLTGGEALWNNWIELRMPIAEQILWLDTFLDAVALWEDPEQISTLGPGNMRYTLGGGVRFTIPQFPVALYVAKRFRIPGTPVGQYQIGDTTYNRWIEWQGGAINWGLFDETTGGFDFVFSFSADLF